MGKNSENVETFKELQFKVYFRQYALEKISTEKAK